MFKVAYALKTFLPGSVISVSSRNVGQEFDLAVTVQDARPNPTGLLVRGVFAAYLDVHYNKSLCAVRVTEVQEITIRDQMGVFALTVNPDTRIAAKTLAIRYDNSTDPYRALTASRIRTALNEVLGLGSVRVSVAPYAGAEAVYRVSFDRSPNVDVPLMADNSPSVTISELLKGDPEDPLSFRTAFQFGPRYPNDQHVFNLPDRLSRLGAFTSSFDLGNSPLELVRVRLRALAAGEAAFEPGFLGLQYPYDFTLVYDNAAATPPEIENEVIGDEIYARGAVVQITH